MTAGICLLTLLGCGELRELRKQNAVLKSGLQQRDKERDRLLERARLLGMENKELAEELAKAKEKERDHLQLLGQLHRAQEEREEQLRELQEMVKDISGVHVVRRSEGSFIVIENEILFASGKADLTAGAKSTLDSTVVAYLEKHPGQQIRIDGHTDGQPIKASPWKDNYHLAAMRAHAVMQYLASKGIPKRQMHIVGFGMNRPLLEPEEPTAPMAENRRVEILLVPEAGRGIEDILKEFGQ